MRAGQLNRRITIQQVTITRDSYGGTVETYTTYKQVWAAIEPLRGREYWEAAAHNRENMTKFTIRHISGVTASMQIQDADGNLFDIQSVINPMDENRFLELLATQTNAEAA